MTIDNHHYHHVFLLFACLALSACSKNHIYSFTEHVAIDLQANALRTGGIAFVTPSTITDQAEDKQTLAFIFTDALKQLRPDVHLATLPQTLGSINRNGLTDRYQRMLANYADTGIMERDTLMQIGTATGKRYSALLKLGGFSRHTKTRWSVFGVRMIDTKFANIRLFLQIWDTQTGLVAWEGVQELDYAVDSVAQQAITFRTVVHEAAQNLISRLPQHEQSGHTPLPATAFVLQNNITER